MFQRLLIFWINYLRFTWRFGLIPLIPAVYCTISLMWNTKLQTEKDKYCMKKGRVRNTPGRTGDTNRYFNTIFTLASRMYLPYFIVKRFSILLHTRNVYWRFQYLINPLQLTCTITFKATNLIWIIFQSAFKYSINMLNY